MLRCFYNAGERRINKLKLLFLSIFYKTLSDVTNVPYIDNNITAARGKSSAIRARVEFIYSAPRRSARLVLTRAAGRNYNASNSRNSDNKAVQRLFCPDFREFQREEFL